MSLPINRVLCGDCVEIAQPPRDEKGRFIEGYHYGLETEFKKGQHWREPKPYWNRDWLYNEYTVKEKSASELAQEQGCTENNILYFLNKHNIKTRSVSEVRAIKYWGVTGTDNPMYGRKGGLNPNWKGGVTPERQTFYNSKEWREVVPKVWKRDKATCQKCKHKKTEGDEFHIHHIISFEVEELRMVLSNLVLLCSDCHHWVHSNANVNNEFIGGEVPE